MSLPSLTNDTFWAILNDTLDDATVNALLWQALGYRHVGGHWDVSAVASEWREAYPEPPDFVGSRPATVKLTRSIPALYKQLLKEELGFGGYQVAELTPHKTRRATAVSWLLAYRAALSTEPKMIRQILRGLLIAFAIATCGFGGIGLDLANLQVVDCPDTPEYANLTSSGASAREANCYLVQGTVVNTSQREIYNADVFGRIYDANGNDVMPERTRLGAIDVVPMGESPFSIRLSVSPDNAMPLQLEQFRAAGFAGAIRR